MTAKRVLVCAPRVPEFDRESGSRRVFHLIEFLQEAGWSVCFVAQDEGAGERHVRVLQQHGVEIVLGFGRHTDEVIAARRFDLAILAFWHLAEKCIPVIRRLSPKTRVIVDMIDLHFLRDARLMLRARYGTSQANMLNAGYASDMVGEVNVYAMADGVLAVSRKEAELVADLVGDPTLTYVVPDHENLPASKVPFEKRKGVLFIGNFWHQPNVGAAEYLCKEILPRVDPSVLRAHPVYIVGNELNDTVREFGRNLSNVRFVGWVPSIVPYLNSARISVIPLLTGAGTKRKLIQTLMVGTPTVSTSVGTEGLDLKNEQHVLVADDPKKFADSMTLLLQNGDLWESLRREGRTHILASRDRQTAAASLRQAVSSVLAKRPKPLPRVIGGKTVQETPALAYRTLVHRIQEAVLAALPTQTTVMIVSNGDDDLLKLGERKAWHFPQSEDGRYAGYHPADSNAAIAHLEALRTKGGDYLIFPNTAFWWLDYYTEFKHHLTANYTTVRTDETCTIVSLRQEPRSVIREHSRVTPEEPALTKELIETLRPRVLPALRNITGNGHFRRKKVLVFGIFLADKQNNIEDVISVLSKTRHKVSQRWVALGGDAATKQVAAVTAGTVLNRTPKFQIVNDLLSKESVNEFDYVVLMDDDVVLPDAFLDHFISMQDQLGFVIAQPARTSNSYIDHPIVEQQKGVLARRTLFVEIGPVVSFHKTAFDLVFPFDLTSPMGWGYENVWAYRVDRSQMKMGIIDGVPVDHSLRKPVVYYRWDEANQQRNAFLSKNEHIPIDECFRVLDVICSSDTSNANAKAIAVR
jgi:glycosyltransferase involved in cell wall biosynthesis